MLAPANHAHGGTESQLILATQENSGQALSIDELAEHLRLTFENENVASHKDVVFVAHSMGGLVTRAFLVKYRSYATKTKLIYFLSTPTTGASIAALGRLASRNPQFSKLVPMKSDEYLADLQRAWLASSELYQIPSFCAYEIQSTGGIKIVDQASATNLCNRPLDPLNYNHIDIVKPASVNDARYRAFSAAYRSDAPKPQTVNKGAKRNDLSGIWRMAVGKDIGRMIIKQNSVGDRHFSGQLEFTNGATYEIAENGGFWDGSVFRLRACPEFS
jgi:pimeloyl-ACP methyl ester carboxylesterase